MPRRSSHIFPALLAALPLLLSACGGDDATGAGNEAGTGNAGGTGTGSATLDWLPPTQRTDNTSVGTLAGYNVYSGRSRESLALVRSVPNPGITTVVLDGLPAGTHYFAVSAYLESGAESDLSAVGSKTVH